MQIHSLTSLSHTVRLGLAAGLLIAAGTLAARATSGEEAEALCQTALTDKYGATAFHDVVVRRHNELPFVYGNADFSDASNVHFRCKVFQGKLEAVHFLVRHPMDQYARLWTTERPHDKEHVNMQLDEKAMSPPPTAIGSPKFERVPD